MKKEHKIPLLRKVSTTYLLSSAVIMIVSAIALYFYTRQLLNAEVEEELFSDKDRIERLLVDDPELKGIPPIMTLEKVNREQQEILIDTLIYDPLQDEIELFRQLSGTKEINGQHYRVAVRVMVIESENILYAIVFTFLSVIFLAFIFQFYLNKSRNQQLWKPFFVNLEKLKRFSLQSSPPLNFEESDILEFDELNRELVTLTHKVRADYQNLKQFTEDVSHELQTPLAIMQAKIDGLINNSEISDSMFAELNSLQKDIQRLKQLNKKLNLLAKIDNNQFKSTETINLNHVLTDVIKNINELTAIEIITHFNKTIHQKMDRHLAVVLFNNLISNAVKHQEGNHPVEVLINASVIEVCNYGRRPLVHPEHIFERFYKESKKSESSGLGLSIVKKICDYYKFIPSYRFQNQKHIFQIDLSPSEI